MLVPNVFLLPIRGEPVSYSLRTRHLPEAPENFEAVITISFSDPSSSCIGVAAIVNAQNIAVNEYGLQFIPTSEAFLGACPETFSVLRSSRTIIFENAGVLWRSFLTITGLRNIDIASGLFALDGRIANRTAHQQVKKGGRHVAV